MKNGFQTDAVQGFGGPPRHESSLFAQSILGATTAPTRATVDAPCARAQLAWLAEIAQGRPNEIRELDRADSEARHQRELLAWLAPLSDEHEAKLRKLLQEEAASLDMQPRYLRFTNDIIAREVWDPAEHPRLDAPPNPGWFATTGGSAPARAPATDAGPNQTAASHAARAGQTHQEPIVKARDVLAQPWNLLAQAPAGPQKPPAAPAAAPVQPVSMDVTLGQVKGKVAFNVQKHLGAYAEVTDQNGRLRRFGDDGDKTIPIEPNGTVEGVKLRFGANAIGSFSSGGPNAGSAYFVQYLKLSTTAMRNGTRAPTGLKSDHDWELDGPVQNADMPNAYGNQKVVRGATMAVDSPGDSYPVPKSAYTVAPDRISLSETPKNLFETIPLAKFMADEQFQAKYEFQSYLVDLATKRPVGYVRWGFTVSYGQNGPEVTVVPPKWNAGQDGNVWK